MFLAYASPPLKQCRNFTNSKTSDGNKRIQKEHTLKKVYSYFSAKPLWNSLKCFGYSYPVKTILKHTTRKCAWILYADYAALTLWLLKGNPDTFFLGIETLIPHSKSILRPYLWRSTTCALRAEAYGVPGDGAQNNSVQSSQRMQSRFYPTSVLADGAQKSIHRAIFLHSDFCGIETLIP